MTARELNEALGRTESDPGGAKFAAAIDAGIFDENTQEFRGVRHDNGNVAVDVKHGGEWHPLQMSSRGIQHSPTGFEWGYQGSGPAALAHSMLGACLLPAHAHVADVLYQEFKREWIAPLNRHAPERPDQGWTIDAGKVRHWIGAQLAMRQVVSDAAEASVTETDEAQVLAEFARAMTQRSINKAVNTMLADKLAETMRDAAALRECLGTMIAAMHCADLALRDRMLFAALPRARELAGGSVMWKPSAYRFDRVAGPESPVPGAKVYRNDHYVASVYPARDGVVHISFSRIDGGAAVDWRDKQHMKNQLIGAENEGVELFPAESRKADGANQFHIFVLADSKARFPFGFTDRLVSDESELPGVRQRPGSGATPEDEAKSREQERAHLASPAGQALKRLAGGGR